MSNEFSNNEIYEDSIEDNNIVKHSISYTNSFQFSRENRNYTEQPCLQISKLLSLNDNKTNQENLSNYNSNDQPIISTSNLDYNNLYSLNENKGYYEINSLESNEHNEKIIDDLESFLNFHQLKNEKSQKENNSYLFNNNLSQSSSSFIENPNRNFFTKIIDLDIIIDTKET